MKMKVYNQAYALIYTWLTSPANSSRNRFRCKDWQNNHTEC